MELLLIGGGIFLGASLVDAGLARGHRLTVFNRGRARNAWPEGVDVVVGDRVGDLGRVAGRRFDAVIDTCGYVPADVRASAAALRDVGRYCFVSSISAYASFAHAPVLESDALASSDGIAEDDRNRDHYGPQKAACERVVDAAFGDARADRPPRADRRPARSDRALQLLAVARARRRRDARSRRSTRTTPIQAIDVRDLADWTRARGRGRRERRLQRDRPAGPRHRSAGRTSSRPAARRRRGAARRRSRRCWSASRSSASNASRHGTSCRSGCLRTMPSTSASPASIAVARRRGPRHAADRRDHRRRDGRSARPLADDPRRRGKLTRDREAALIAAWNERALTALAAVPWTEIG